MALLVGQKTAALSFSVTVASDQGAIGAVRLVDETGAIYGPKQVDGKLRTSTKPYLYDIAEGLIAGHTAVRRFGFNPDVAVAWETVCGTSALANYLTAAERLQIASDDADDDGPAGNGARTVTVSGLDANYDPLSETVTMNGVANVLTDASFLRVLCLSVVTAGTTGSNEGTITASNNAGAVILQQIEPNENECLCAAYTVPDGYILYIVQGLVTEGSTKGSQVAFWKRPFGGLWSIARTNVLLDSGLVTPMSLPMPVPAKTDIELRAKAVIAGAAVSAGFEGWLEEV